MILCFLGLVLGSKDCNFRLLLFVLLIVKIYAEHLVKLNRWARSFLFHFFGLGYETIRRRRCQNGIEYIR